MSFRHYPIPRSFYLALSLSESINIARQLFLEFTSHNIELDNIKDAEGKWYFAAKPESSARSRFAQGPPIQDQTQTIP